MHFWTNFTQFKKVWKFSYREQDGQAEALGQGVGARIVEAVLTYCEDRDRELLVEEIISVYRGCRARSELTSRAELM